MSPNPLPRPVDAFLQATWERDLDAFLAVFAPEGVLTDMGEAYQGEALKTWAERLYLGANVKVKVLDAAQQDDKTVLTVMVDGDYEEFGVTAPFELVWTFTLAGDKIAALQMVEKKKPYRLAPVIDAFVNAMNSFDGSALIETFVDDALVNDIQREFRGKPAIRKWADREIIGDKVTMRVTGMREHYGDPIVVAKMDGEYDKAKVPDPLILTFYFSLSGDKIAKLIILHNKPTS